FSKTTGASAAKAGFNATSKTQATTSAAPRPTRLGARAIARIFTSAVGRSRPIPPLDRLSNLGATSAYNGTMSESNRSKRPWHLVAGLSPWPIQFERIPAEHDLQLLPTQLPQHRVNNRLTPQIAARQHHVRKI